MNCSLDADKIINQFPKDKTTSRFWLFFFVCIILCTYTNNVYAQKKCDPLTSILCDSSWRGSSHFYEWIENQNRRFVLIHKDEYQKKSDVQIWLHAPQLDAQSLQNELAKGTRMLILDESRTSAQWYEFFYNTQVTAIDSPFMDNAAHINGNPDLPVFNPDDNMLEQLALPREALQWQIAMNHPTPLLIPSNTQTPELKFIYTIVQNDGMAFIIRDESLLTNLMFSSLDNKKWLQVVLNYLCDGRPQCFIQFNEPNDQYIPSEPTISDDSFQSKAEQAYTKVKKNYQSLIDSNGENIKKLPWAFILFLLAAIWAIIALLMSFPASRTK